MENKYSIGEPVAICAWVKGIHLCGDNRIEYRLEIVDDDGNHLLTLVDVSEDLITTIFNKDEYEKV